MIQDTVTRSRRAALTSDRWHVVHARWAGDPSGEADFTRTIVSEHEDRPSAVKAAREILTSMATEQAARSATQRDQVFVRKPEFKSFKSAKRVDNRLK